MAAVWTDKTRAMLGLCMRSGNCVSGDTPVEAAVRRNKAKLVILSAQASENTLKQYTHLCNKKHILMVNGPDKETLGGAIGKGEQDVGGDHGHTLGEDDARYHGGAEIMAKLKVYAISKKIQDEGEKLLTDIQNIGKELDQYTRVLEELEMKQLRIVKQQEMEAKRKAEEERREEERKRREAEMLEAQKKQEEEQKRAAEEAAKKSR